MDLTTNQILEIINLPDLTSIRCSEFAGVSEKDTDLFFSETLKDMSYCVYWFDGPKISFAKYGDRIYCLYFFDEAADPEAKESIESFFIFEVNKLKAKMFVNNRYTALGLFPNYFQLFDIVWNTEQKIITRIETKPVTRKEMLELNYLPKDVTLYA
jgi:hypothetical protein